MISVGICDDEMVLLEKLNRFVQACYAQNQTFVRVGTFLNGQQLLYEIEDGSRFDLVLLDIEMPQMDGMELAGHIRKALPDVLIIFVTSHMEYVLDAYELSVFRYIPKRDFEDRLRHALLDAAAMVEVQLRESYVIHNKNRLERIPLRNLLYITHEGKNAVLVTDIADPGTGRAARFHVRKTLQQVYDELDEREFLFIDRGCIVNLSCVMGIQEDCCVMKDGSRLAVSQSRLQNLKSRLLEFWERHM
ncbi:MAG: response regulator transcription factor [Lachnospiraceae bacterium]|nr:response regulator transcription factor [Lachnospiraceae bacterium]MDE6918690.1 LytTR family DNA-binding domain-containing protein [Lachnospiraceae bacterium]MDE6940364.1 LytTR family DNA-binding domain-containing protein [Lachnospiraceae bacterium]